jgi:ABC-type glycerol-3-phosphate transport system permease component
LLLGDFGISGYIVLPLTLTLITAAAVFYPINAWCFNPFTGDSLNLHALHKGR